MEVVESYIPLETEFANLITSLRAEYDSWLRQSSSSKYSSVSTADTLAGTLREVSPAQSHSQAGMNLG